jgi:hypothetical protein
MGWLQVVSNRLKFPPVRRIRWFNLALLATTSALALYGMLYVPRDCRTLMFAVAYYVFSMLGPFLLKLRYIIFTQYLTHPTSQE